MRLIKGLGTNPIAAPLPVHCRSAQPIDRQQGCTETWLIRSPTLRQGRSVGAAAFFSLLWDETTDETILGEGPKTSESSESPTALPESNPVFFASYVRALTEDLLESVVVLALKLL